MTLVLKVENETSLPNGAPTTMRVAQGRTLDIGRGAHLDWSLPDPSRFISGKHCEIRHRDGAFWLYDVSTNGTFLNDNARRIQAPHRLIDGDRLTIGAYVITVTLEGEAPQSEALQDAALQDEALRDEALQDKIDLLDVAAASPDTAPASAEAFVAAAPAASAFIEEAVEAAFAPAAPCVEEEPVPPPPQPAFEPAAQTPPASASFEAPMPEPVLAPDVPMPPPLLAPEVFAPEPEPASPGAPAVTAGMHEGATAEAFLARFAKGAGIPDNIFARQDSLKVAEDMGALMRLVADNITQLLAARFKAKRFARTSNQTMIQALDNNPLKFAPTPEDALRIMFGPRTSGYLDARRALDAAFKDLKMHQLKTFSAMQGAVNMLVEDLDPAEIDTALGTEKSMLDRLGARKARLWDLYLARWQAKTLRHQDGLTDAFMLYFAECYDRSDEKP